MLNSKGERELCYVAKVEEIKPLEGYDRVEYARIGSGWWCVVKKGDFQVGDLAVYFEVDSKLPEKECFEFCAKYKYKVKTQRLCKVISQGLLMHPRDLGLTNLNEGDFLTKQLGVTYYEAEDNARKADVSKYTSMKDRHKKFFKTKLGKWLMAREWGRKLCFFFLGRKKDKKKDWPNWVVKTDEERAQNCFNQMKSFNTSWYSTEKIDGSSTTFTMKQAKPKKREMLVCSRNVVYDSPEKENKNYYKDTEGNVYLEMAEKYNMREVLNYILDTHPTYDFITIQGETYGGKIQQRNYGPEHKLAIFNVIYQDNGKAPVRLNPIQMVDFIKDVNQNLNKVGDKSLCTVPVLGEIDLPETCEDMLKLAGGNSLVDGGMREGIVLRSVDGTHSFKAVDNNYLLKYHG